MGSPKAPHWWLSLLIGCLERQSQSELDCPSLVGNPCSRTLYDPLKTSNRPGNVRMRGAIVHSDIRPPFAVEIKIQGKQILAIRTE